jgi:hypothetical protein
MERSVPCSKCGGARQFLGPSIEIPPKRDVAGWNRLREEVAKFHVAAVEEKFKQEIRRRHDLEKRIRELESRARSAGRDKLIKQLRAQVAKEDDWRAD